MAQRISVPFAPGGGGAGPTALDDLTDVDVPAPNNGDVLTYDSGSGDWVAAAGAAQGLSSATPQPLGTAGPGTGTDVSREDHVHAMPALDDLTDVDAGTPSDGDVLTYDNATGDWIAAAPTGGASISSATPQALGVAAAGSGTDASADDHVHPMPDLGDLGDVSAAAPSDGDVLTYDLGTTTWTTAAPLALSSATPQALGTAAAGSGTAASRDDHVHAAPALNDLSNVSVAAPSNNDVLTFDSGTSTWIAAAAGGGGLTGLTNVSGTGYAGLVTSTTNDDIILGANGTGSIQAQVADSTTTGGNARGTRAVDWQQDRNNANQVASGTESTVGGGRRNTASSTQSTVAGGDSNTASNIAATVPGGQSNTASGFYTTVAGGSSNTASGTNATVAGGQSNTASGSYSTVPGGERGLANQYGMLSHALGRFSTNGDAQYSRMILRRQTTDATPTVLSADGAAPAADTRVVLPARSAYCFDVYVIATQSAGGSGTASDSAWWHFRGGIRRDNANNTTLIGTNVTETGADAGAAAWTVTCTADDTNNALQVEVTGEADKTIRWVATVQYSRVAY